MSLLSPAKYSRGWTKYRIIHDIASRTPVCYLFAMKPAGLSSTTSPKFLPSGFIFWLVLALLVNLLAPQDGHSQPRSLPFQAPDTGEIRLTDDVVDDSCPAIPIIISADPESALVIVDGNEPGLRLPARLIFTKKKHDIRVQANGYEPLSYELRCENADSVSLMFILRTETPPLLVAESLGLALLPIQIILDSAAADHRMKSYSNATEMFMVFPFGQGVITRVLGGDTYRKESNTLIISGAVLSVGCFVVGKVLSGRQRSSIRTKNERINRDNNTALFHNREVDRKVQIANRERKTRWDKENKNRGLVNVLKYP